MRVHDASLARAPSPADRPAARRLRRPSWRDGRLLLGVVLVLASVLLGARVVAAAQATTRAYVATRDLSPGESVAAVDLRPVEVRLGSLAADYVRDQAVSSARPQVVQAVRAGQLVPAAALASREQASQRQVSVPVAAGSAGALVRGTSVEVWVSARSSEAGTDVYAAPRRVVQGATVARDPEDQSSSLTGGGSTVTLHLWVPASVVPDLLTAVDARDRITAVPLPGAVLRGSR